jgi:hypothetical protein
VLIHFVNPEKRVARTLLMENGKPVRTNVERGPDNIRRD